MVDPFLRFPNAQRVLINDLEALAGQGHTGSETPANLADVLPFVRVMRGGGSAAGHVNAHPVVDIDVFAATYAEADVLSEQILQHLVGPPPGIAVLDRVECDVLPQELPWGDGSVRRFGATYSITIRRRMSV